jgi:hypothetical protein
MNNNARTSAETPTPSTTSSTQLLVGAGSSPSTIGKSTYQQKVGCCGDYTKPQNRLNDEPSQAIEQKEHKTPSVAPRLEYEEEQTRSGSKRKRTATDEIAGRIVGEMSRLQEIPKHHTTA